MHQEYAGPKKLLSVIPVRKPLPQVFVRVHPGVEYRQLLTIIEIQELQKEIYLVDGRFIKDVAVEEVRNKVVYTAITQQMDLFLWPVPLQDPTRAPSGWYTSMVDAVELVKTTWIRLRTNMANGAYDILEAQGKLAEPEWPDLPFNELLRIAFRHKLVDGPEHSVIKRLDGRM